MIKHIFLFATLFSFSFSSMAQGREELERQRNELKKELEQTEKLLKSNKQKTNENLLQWRLINQKVELQDKLVSNINKDLRAINDDLYTTQLEINRYDRLLDTLRSEYAKSMVYAYKNRSNYDFLNFIFSADNFNDAVKRISYLNSYRDYREMQGQNILRTQLYRQKKSEELAKTKKDKNESLSAKSDELKTLEKEENEKDRIVVELKKKSSDLSKRVSQKKSQMKKVENVIAAAIKKAKDDARKAAAAKAAEEKRKNAAAAKALADKKAADDRKRIEAEKKALASNTNPTTVPKTTAPVPVTEKKVVETVVKPKAPAKPISELLNSDNMALNTSFEKNKGSLPWPVDRGYPLMHFGLNKLPTGSDLATQCVTIACEVGSSVKSVFDGEVLLITPVDDMNVVTVQHGKYFAHYSNLSSTNIKVGQKIKTGQVIGTVGTNLDGMGVLDFYLGDEYKDYDPETWLRKR